MPSAAPGPHHEHDRRQVTPVFGETMQTSLPVAALTVLGILLAVLGLFVGGSVELVAIGLVAIFGAGVLQVAGNRR